MESLTGSKFFILITLSVFSGYGFYFVISKYIRRLRQIEDELFGRPVSPDKVLAFIKELYQAERNETNIPD